MFDSAVSDEINQQRNSKSERKMFYRIIRFHRTPRAEESKFNPASWQRPDAERYAPSGEYLLHQLTVHVRQTEITPLEAIGQFFVIEPQQMQNGGLQIVDMDFIAHN